MPTRGHWNHTGAGRLVQLYAVDTCCAAILRACRPVVVLLRLLHRCCTTVVVYAYVQTARSQPASQPVLLARSRSSQQRYCGINVWQAYRRIAGVRCPACHESCRNLRLTAASPLALLLRSGSPEPDFSCKSRGESDSILTAIYYEFHESCFA